MSELPASLSASAPLPKVRPFRFSDHTRSMKAALGAYALLLPSLIFLTLFTYLPLVEVLRDSLFIRPVPREPAKFAGAANYIAIASDQAFAKALTNTGLYAAATVIPSLILGLAFAMALTSSTKVNAALRTVFVLPMLIPLVAAASLFLFVFLPGVGLLDHYLGQVFARMPNWIGDPDIALWSIAGLTVWKNAGYYMLFFLAGLQAVPPDAYDAAYLEGATPWQRLHYVTLPYLQPTIAFVTVIALLAVITQVDHVFVLTKGGPSNSTNLMLFYIYQQAVENYDIGKASAATVVSLLVLGTITVLSLRTLRRAFGGGVE